MMHKRQSIPYIFLLLATLVVSFAAAATSEQGLMFLKNKQAEPGVVTLPSGLLYKEIRAGSGKSPTVNSPCECHYAGTLMDGTEFDSSYKRGAPSTFAPNQVIGGTYSYTNVVFSN
jgi:FKBP-type peptidyl-prolyl cis-trans isomerase FklB